MKFSPAGYLNIFSSLLYDPKKQIVMPFTSAMCTRDTDYRRVMDNDPREHRFATPRLLVAIAGGQLRAARLRKRLAAPVLFLVAGEHDQLVDPAAAQKFFAGFTIGDKKLVRYPDMYHALSIDLGREKVFGDILEWVGKEKT
jgi:alpha-beta hydrolase superfamily lysophospholipase